MGRLRHGAMQCVCCGRGWAWNISTFCPEIMTIITMGWPEMTPFNVRLRWQTRIYCRKVSCGK